MQTMMYLSCVDPARTTMHCSCMLLQCLRPETDHSRSPCTSTSLVSERTGPCHMFRTHSLRRYLNFASALLDIRRTHSKTCLSCIDLAHRQMHCSGTRSLLLSSENDQPCNWYTLTQLCSSHTDPGDKTGTRAMVLLPSLDAAPWCSGSSLVQLGLRRTVPCRRSYICTSETHACPGAGLRRRPRKQNCSRIARIYLFHRSGNDNHQR